MSKPAPDIAEMLENMQSALEVLREKYPFLAKLSEVETAPPVKTRWKWDVFYASDLPEFREELNLVEREGYEIINTHIGEYQGEVTFFMVVRRPETEE